MFGKGYTEWFGGMLLRLTERLIPIPALRLVLWPVAALMSAADLAPHRNTTRLFERLPPSRRPGLTKPRWLLRLWKRRIPLHMTKVFRFWPDRLRDNRWQQQCRFEGWSRLESSLAESRSVILATLHYGCLTELYHLLRARQLKVAALTTRRAEQRSAFRKRLNSLGDQANGLSGIPWTFELRQLRQAQTFLNEGGRLLLVALDGSPGTRAVVVENGDFQVLLATGAFHLAANTNAAVLPCLMRITGNLTTTIYFGTPVPSNALADRSRHQIAAEHIFSELAPLIAENPELCGNPVLKAMQTPVKNQPDARCDNNDNGRLAFAKSRKSACSPYPRVD
jgi:lauroyl/myristoyl acyltransferase